MTGTSGKIDRSTMLAFVAMALGVFVVANDFTALSVAIPEIEHDLNTTLKSAQWVINGYALVFGVLIVTGGRLADLFGRKRIFMIGAGIFAVFSLAAGLMPSVVPLIVCRGLMGIGGALMWPAILGMTYALLPEEKAGLAGGLILGVAGLGNAVGPLLGGFLTDELSWRWVFFINLPVTAFAVLVTYRVVHESAVDATERHIDYAGIAVLSVGIISILLALDEGPEDGFGDPAILALFVLGAVMLGSFLVVERRQGEGALVPRDVLRNRVFTGVVRRGAADVGDLLLGPPLPAAVLREGPRLLPVALGRGPAAADARVRGQRPSSPVRSTAGSAPRLVVSAGAACLAIGIFWLSLLDADSSLRVARARHGRARHRRGALLLVDHHGRGHRVRPVEIEPGRRHRLHVPDRRRRRRPRFQHRDRRVGIEPDRRHQPRLQDRRRARGAGLLLVLAVIGRHEEATPRASLRTHHRAHA